MPDFTNTAYLREGTPIQRKCFLTLMETGVMEILAPCDPVVAGTIPIGINIPGSDIDILCRAWDFGALGVLLRKYFESYTGFSCSQSCQRGIPVMVCSFMAGDMQVEIFAQDVPATGQDGYRHMITEYRLLQIHGDRLRDKVVELKLSGIKTEPAFAVALGLAGDPYAAVLEKGRELGLF